MAVVVYANSGYIADVQAAVNEVIAAGGVGTIFIPAGQFLDDYTNRYVLTLGGITIFGAGKDQTIIGMSKSAPAWTSMWVLDGSNGKRARISGIGFYGYADDIPYGGIMIEAAKDFRVDHCLFAQMGADGINPGRDNYQNLPICGVIDHCDFVEMFKPNIDICYGVGVISSYNEVLEASRWGTIDDYLGKYTDRTVFIEDCYFYACRHDTTSFGGSHVVTRHCTHTYMKVGYQSGYTDQHGAYTDALGGRCIEVYGNQFFNPSDNPYYNYARACALRQRGGGGVFFENEVHDMSRAVEIADDDGNSRFPQCKPHDLWIWGNTLVNVANVVENTNPSVVLNTDYFLSAKTGYVPYTYPHPLTLEETPTCPTGYHWDEVAQSCVLDTPSTVTPYSAILTAGATYRVTVPAQVTSGGQTYNFQQWNDGDTNPVKTIALTADTTLTATYAVAAPTTVTLNVVAGANGTVSPSGSQTLTIGQTYQFTATPNANYLLDYWDLNGVNQGSTNPLSLLATAGMNGQTLTAHFKAQTVTLNVVSGGNGTVSPSGTSLLTVGQTYQFTATPNVGYAFDYWDLNGTNLGANNPLSLTVTSDMNGKQLTAHFKLTLIILTAIAGANGSVSPAGSQTLTVGNTYSFMALSNSGYLFDHWTLGTSNLGSSNPLNITATADMNGKTLTALFSAIPPVQIQFTVAANISQGTVNPSPGLQTFNVGSIVQFTATALQGYAFKQWMMDGTIYLNNPLNLTITSDMAGKTLTAEFVKTQVILQAIAGTNGSMAPSGSLILIVGQSYQFAAVPNTGYNFDHWDLGGENKGSTNPLQLTATVDIDGKILTALFSAIPPITVNVIIAVAGNGTTDLTPGSHEFHVGDTITIAAIPSAGTAFKQWQLDGMTYTDNPLSLPITEALNGKTLTAEFISLTPQAASLLIPAVAVITLIGIGAAYSLLKKKGGR